MHSCSRCGFSIVALRGNPNANLTEVIGLGRLAILDCRTSEWSETTHTRSAKGFEKNDSLTPQLFESPSRNRCMRGGFTATP